MSSQFEVVIDACPYGLALSFLIQLNGQNIRSINFLANEQSDSIAASTLSHPDIISQIEGYLSGTRHSFSLAIEPHGTPFQLRVWQALQEIPYGNVMSYGALAKQLGTSARAIGGACRVNPIPLIIPCHRIVAVNGIGGFAGDAHGGKVLIKRWLLTHEQARSN